MFIFISYNLFLTSCYNLYFFHSRSYGIINIRVLSIHHCILSCVVIHFHIFHSVKNFLMLLFFFSFTLVQNSKTCFSHLPLNIFFQFGSSFSWFTLFCIGHFLSSSFPIFFIYTNLKF